MAYPPTETPLDFFHLFFTEEILEQIRTNKNITHEDNNIQVINFSIR